MLGSADLEVVQRDRQVGGLRLLLDSGALGMLVSERTGTPCRVVPRRLRYKPGTSCVLSFGLHTGPHVEGEAVPCIARAYAREAAAKLEKPLKDLGEADLLVVDRSLGLVVTTLRGDRHLAAVSRLFDQSARLRLLERLLPDHTGLTGNEVRTLRHNPERRWVGVLDTDDHERVVLRAFPVAAAERPALAYARLEGTGPRTPTLLGRSRRHGLLAVTWAPGVTLDPSASSSAFHAAGAALARLHLRRPPRLEVTTPDVHAARVHAAGAQVADLLPCLGPLAARLARTLADRLRLSQIRGSMLHGDFSPDQVVLDEDGEPTLIDLDSACLGHPAQDLGSAWAAALAGARTSAEQHQAATRVAALAEGYGTVRLLPDESELTLYRDSYLLGRAAEGFRTRLPDWPDQMARMLTLVATGVGGASWAETQQW